MKDSPIQVIITTIYNAIQTVVVLYILGVSSHDFFGYLIPIIQILFVSVMTYFLIKNKKFAWVLLVIWLFFVTVSINFPNFSYDIAYGFEMKFSFFISSGSSRFAVAADIISLIIMFVLFSAKPHFNKIK